MIVLHCNREGKHSWEEEYILRTWRNHCPKVFAVQGNISNADGEFSGSSRTSYKVQFLLSLICKNQSLNSERKNK